VKTSGDFAHANYVKGSETPNGTAVTTTTTLEDGSRKIYLYYTRKTYTLTLKAGNYIASVSGGGTYKWGQSVVINATLESQTGYNYSFKKWTSSDTSLLTNSTTKKRTVTMSKGNVTLTASGTKNVIELDITYDGNGGYIGNSTRYSYLNYDYGSAYPSVSNPTRSGYTFVGWYTSKTGGSRIYPGTTTINETSDHTIYAQWTASTTPDNTGGSSSSGGSCTNCTNGKITCIGSSGTEMWVGFGTHRISESEVCAFTGMTSGSYVCTLCNYSFGNFWRCSTCGASEYPAVTSPHEYDCPDC